MMLPVYQSARLMLSTAHVDPHLHFLLLNTIKATINQSTRERHPETAKRKPSVTQKNMKALGTRVEQPLRKIQVDSSVA